ncbi:MAG TPA: hypothetical protein VGK48_19680 [Terriglobia bacterium]|jgi:hypothetical protein
MKANSNVIEAYGVFPSLASMHSAAYGPEAALTILIPAGLAGLPHILPISLAIITLLTIVYFSYRQTIGAYPEGCGSRKATGASSPSMFHGISGRGPDFSMYPNRIKIKGRRK